MAPTVTATPGPGKLPAAFAADQTACAAQTTRQMSAAVQAANNQVTGAALQNLLTGTGDNAVTVNAQATSALQQQYDNTYSACMYAMGDNVPPYYMQPVYPTPTEYSEGTTAPRPRKRVAHKATAPTAQAAQAGNSSFVVPAPSATPSGGGSGFVEPAATAPSLSSNQFVLPAATH